MIISKLNVGDQVRVLWSNGHGYDLYKVVPTLVGQGPPVFEHLATFEYTADGGVQEVSFGPADTGAGVQRLWPARCPCGCDGVV